MGGYVRELVRLQQFVEVESFSPSHELSTVEFQGTKLHRFSSDFKQIPLAYRLTLRRLRESRIDSVFLLSGGITIFGLMLLLYCTLTRRRTAMLLYGKDILQARRSLLRLLLLVASTILANRVLTNSRFTASLVPFVDLQKTRVLYPSVDPTIATPDLLSSSQPERRVLFVGRLVKRKGLKDLVDAFRILSEEIPDATLEVVGDGPERSQLERLVADLDLGGKISFNGTMKGEALYQRYSSCYVFAMPSITLNDDVEGFGTVFLEAGLFGKPSVGTFSGGIPEAVDDNRTGLLVPEGHVTEIALALRRLFADTNLAQSFGRNARERVLKQFTWAESTKQLIRSLAKGADP